ncbi:MAG: diacylglycerol kinase family lipid kinase [Bacteroidales bacterium]|jgi:YegS/Rv2252/BmrU family lipid kinase|nr:diacylglycerol kinase family lipid kinase [Bacteroidales bacterium]
MKSNKTIFILNPISGSGKKRRKNIEKTIRQYIQNDVIEGEIWYSQYAGHATELAKIAIKENVKSVVVAGGDGSINEVAKVLVHTDTALGIIPAGSGNGLAHHLQLPFDINKALEVILLGHIKKADVLNVDGHYVFSVAGLGFDAQVAQHYKSSTRRGLLTYIRSSVFEYFKYDYEKITLQFDQQEITANVFFCLFSNANQFGYNFGIMPQAELFDNQLDIAIVPPISFFEVLKALPKVWNGKIEKISYIQYFKTNILKIIREKEGIINCDGDPYPTGKEFCVYVIPNALNIILP